MATGTVKWFSDDKGFGFITPDQGSRDLFVHHTGINANGYRTLAEGARVSYEEEQGDNADVQGVSPSVGAPRATRAPCRTSSRSVRRHDAVAGLHRASLGVPA